MSYDYLLYLVREMHKSMKTMDELKQEVAASVLPQNTKELFYRIIDTANVASLSEKDRIRFEAEWKGYLDTMSCLEMSKEEGKCQRSLEIAKSMKYDGVEFFVIAKYTSLSLEEIEQL